MPIINSEQLPEDEAHLEANMLRVKMREMIDHEPTAEDYEQALKAVEELKEYAANESNGDKIFLKMMQVGNKYFLKGVDFLANTLTLGLLKDRIKKDTEYRLHMFDNDEQELAELKRQAENLEK